MSDDEGGTDPRARLARQLDFLLAVDALKRVSRASRGTWPEFDVTRAQLVGRTGHVADGSEALWAHCLDMIDEAVGRGWVAADDA